MAKLFYFSEIIEFAVQREKESISLYQKLADQAGEKKVKDLFQILMAEEKKHEEFYMKMLAITKKEQSPGGKENEEYINYMRELIDASRSVKMPICEAKTCDIEKMLDFALDREKDSILFYVGLYNYLPSDESEMVNTIIHEEMKHLTLLAEYRKSL